VLAAANSDPTSIVLIQWGHTYIKTDAVFRIARLLSGGYSWLYLLLVIPRPIRDQFYDWFAAHRYKWFGRKDSCPIPSPEQRARFLD
jgi:predicted DCC family thiol-disulfide oxidoreductase YuxK